MMWVPKELWAARSLSHLPLGIAGDTAFRIFCTPELSHYRASNHRSLTERARFHLRKADRERVVTPVADIQTYTFQPDRDEPLGTVLVVHGWTAEASFMTALAEPIRRAGYRVVLFDLPAHGLSGGSSTSLIDCARATAHVGARFGPLVAVVAHSFGGLISLVATEGHQPMPFKLDVPRFVLIACPNRLSEVTADFSSRWGLSVAGQHAFEQRVERLGGRPLESFVVAKLLQTVGSRALVIHDVEDRDVAFTSAQDIAAAVNVAQLKLFRGFGHRNILLAPPVTRAVASYLLSVDD